VKNPSGTKSYESNGAIAPGEFVAMHVVRERRGVLSRRIFVGKEPWSDRRELKGECKDGRLVARVDDITSLPIVVLFRDLLSEAVHCNPFDSKVVEYCGDMALKLKDMDIKQENVGVKCPKCESNFDHAATRFNFPPGFDFMWFTEAESKMNPGKMAATVCVLCLKAMLKFFGDQKKESVSGVNKSVSEKIMGGFGMSGYVDPKSFDRVIREIKENIDSVPQRA